MLLDEPMAGMGPAESAEIVRLLARLKGRLAIVLVEHDMDAVFALADRITVMVYGRVVATGLPAAIRADAEVRRAYLGEEDADVPPPFPPPPPPSPSPASGGGQGGGIAAEGRVGAKAWLAIWQLIPALLLHSVWAGRKARPEGQPQAFPALPAPLRVAQPRASMPASRALVQAGQVR